AAPEMIVVLIALAVLAVDVFTLRELELRFRWIVTGMIACAGCAGAMAWMMVSHPTANLLGGMFVVDPVTQMVKIAILGLTIFTVLLSMDSDFTDHVGEYLALILLAAVGMMFLVSAEDIIMIFIALELTSLSLYIFTWFNKRDTRNKKNSV